jgi:hypothetical protein
MKFLLHTKESIADRILEFLRQIAQVDSAADSESLADYDLLILDAKTCGSDSESQDRALLKDAFDRDRAVLVLNAAEDQKQALADYIGFQSHGAGMAYFVKPVRDNAGRTHYRILEKTFPTSGSLWRGDARGDGEKPIEQSDPMEINLADSSENREIHDRELRSFGKSLTEMLQPERAAEGIDRDKPSDLKWKAWIYSRDQSFDATGPKFRFGPPPLQHLSCYTTYEFQAYLNNWPETGAFQFLFLRQGGIYETNGMKNDTDHVKGWYLTQFSPTYPASKELFYYSSSPANVSDSKDVTTSSGFTVEFNTSGGGAQYNFSSSETQRIWDWRVTQLTGTSWQYYQQIPYSGISTTFPYDMVGNKGVLKALPEISKYSLQFDLQVVWKTNSVEKKWVNVTGENRMRTDYIITEHTSGTGWEGDWWYYITNPSPTFALDLSLVS